MRQKTWIVFSLILLLTLAIVGCEKKPTAEEIVTKVQETLQTITDAHGIVLVSGSVQGIEVSMKAEVWEKTPNKGRAVLLESSEAERVGATIVSDGEQAWFYDPSTNQVLVGPVGEVQMPLSEEALLSLQGLVQKLLDASEAELAGEETILDRETYKLTLRPREGESELYPGNGTATLWVDQEQWIVLKATYKADELGQGSVELQSFELNPGLSDDWFQFEVPEGAEVVDIESQRPQALTLDEDQAQAGFPLLLPTDVPADATLIEVFKMGESIILRYNHSPDVSFTIIQGPELLREPPAGETSQAVTVRGQPATALSDEATGSTFLYWSEAEVVITIAGHLSLDQAIQVAESLQ